MNNYKEGTNGPLIFKMAMKHKQAVIIGNCLLYFKILKFFEYKIIQGET